MLCECGCGREVKVGRRFIHGHNFKGITGKNYPQYGKHCSEVTKDKMSKARLGKKIFSDKTKEKIRQIVTEEWKNNLERRKNIQKGNNSKNFGRIPSLRCLRGNRYYYNSPLQGRILLRSSYELLYAKYLDEHKILWLYEIETFDLGNTTYTPDFFLPKFEKFIEIKGYMRKEAQEKINKFLEEYTFDLEILRKKDLIKLGIDIKMKHINEVVI